MTLYRVFNAIVDCNVGLISRFLSKYAFTSFFRFLLVGTFIGLFLGWYYLFGCCFANVKLSDMNLLIGKPMLLSWLFWLGLGMMILAEALFCSAYREVTAALVAHELDPLDLDSSMDRSWRANKPKFVRAMRTGQWLEFVGLNVICWPVSCLCIKWADLHWTLDGQPAPIWFNVFNVITILALLVLVIAVISANFQLMRLQGEKHVENAKRALH